MSGPAELAIAAGVLVDAGLKSTVLLGGGWVAALLLRRGSAAQRHVVWASTLATLPFLAVFAGLRGAEIAVDVPWVVGIWALGVAMAAFPILRGWVGLVSLRSRAAADPTIPGLFHSSEVSGPVTWGLLRPVIALPLCAAGWSKTRLNAALAHERAHISRSDWAVHLGAHVVCALFWFHPLVWFARRALAREAEHAADDVVLEQGVRPSDYASLLLSLTHAKRTAAALGVGSSLVGDRVRAVLDQRSRSSRRWPVWGTLGLVLLFSAPLLGSWPTWSAPAASLTCATGILP